MNLYKIIIEREDDVYVASSIGKKVAKELGLSCSQQTKVVVSIMELTRNIVFYAGKGELHIRPLPHCIEIIAIDKGPGIKNLEQILTQTYSSKTGLGLGVTGVRRLMDEFEITSNINHGTKVRAVKWLSNGGTKY
ncbi:ATP-binding protein [Bacillus sp. JJ1532]|uniref:ATP-binding protein n=1 Tax=unclassified Bacillus (in: firmicutes) TaxID=185979 RepID=UPI002FFFE958